MMGLEIAFRHRVIIKLFEEQTNIAFRRSTDFQTSDDIRFRDKPTVEIFHLVIRPA
jgi:hypothetical protein